MIIDHRDHQAVLQPSAAPIIIHTFGPLRASRSGAELPIAGGGVGRGQLVRQLDFLLFNLGRRVFRSDLVAVARWRKQRRRRPGFVVSGLCTMLRAWGLGPALSVEATHITLRRHPCWRSDGDLLRERLDQAYAFERAGDQTSAIACLATAVELCTGTYLEDVDGDVSFSGLADEARTWCAYQREAIARLARLCLRDAIPQNRTAGVALADRLLRHCGLIRAEDYDIAAEAANLAGVHRLAAIYTERARRLRG